MAIAVIKPVAPEVAHYIEVLKHASRHKNELNESQTCACFFCFKKFVVKDITSWIDQNQTALCPKCGIDSVLGSASGHSIDDRFLRKLHQHHFGYRAR